LINIPMKTVLSSAIGEAIGSCLQEKCYLAHLAATNSFEEYSRLACVSTSICECLEYLAGLTPKNAARFEVVCQLVNVHVYQSLAEHKNSGTEENFTWKLRTIPVLEIHTNDKSKGIEADYS
jgi:hypothetical protein